ncbi:unnamed protein product [Didymodactylos carnosus]|uniref:Uncharacterized protein n=1 Tax=Didymodactylos carnosus TaxID=1234261 RepID=A0A8S2G4Y6_9BILA|nr:unnamed protein product [Didymodactylos carnosus]CAF4457108.1 unnamed protein product [Didymodactylos carnosus]
MKMTGPLENTIVGKLRSKELASMFAQNLTVLEMQKQNWFIPANDQLLEEEDDNTAVSSEIKVDNRDHDTDVDDEINLRQQSLELKRDMDTKVQKYSYVKTSTIYNYQS